MHGLSEFYHKSLALNPLTPDSNDSNDISIDDSCFPLDSNDNDKSLLDSKAIDSDDGGSVKCHIASCFAFLSRQRKKPTDSLYIHSKNKYMYLERLEELSKTEYKRYTE